MEVIWMGHCTKSNEVLIGTRQEVARAWAVRRKPEDERWRAEEIEAAQGTPPAVPGRAGPRIPIRVLVEVYESAKSDEFER